MILRLLAVVGVYVLMLQLECKKREEPTWGFKGGHLPRFMSIYKLFLPPSALLCFFREPIIVLHLSVLCVPCHTNYTYLLTPHPWGSCLVVPSWAYFCRSYALKAAIPDFNGSICMVSLHHLFINCSSIANSILLKKTKQSKQPY